MPPMCPFILPPKHMFQTQCQGRCSQGKRDTVCLGSAGEVQGKMLEMQGNGVVKGDQVLTEDRGAVGYRSTRE